MVQRNLMGQSRRSTRHSEPVRRLPSPLLLVVGLATSFAGCGSSATDETTRARADEDGADDDAAEGTDPESGASDGSSAMSNIADDESITSLCERLCEAWADCPEAEGAECIDECTASTESRAESACYPLVLAVYDCVLEAGECPEQAPCDAEEDAYAACEIGTAGSTGATTSTGSTMVGPNGSAVSGSDSGGAVPSDPNAIPPADGDPVESDVDPTEHFGGEDSTPEAILEAAEIAQCSEFEVDEFSCGGSGTSFGGPQCTVECHDPDDRVWASLCRDGVCRCQYDGITYCQCPHEGMSEDGCNSCCPQLTDADFEF